MPDLDEHLEHLMRQLAEPVDVDGSFERIRTLMIRRRRQRQAKIATGLTAAAACVALAATALVTLGGTNGQRLRTTGRLTSPTVSAPPATVTIPPPTTSVPTPAFRFHPDAYVCVPAPASSIKRTWQVSAPRTIQAGVTSIPIGLRNKMAGSMGDRQPIDPQILLPAPDIALSAEVIGPDGVTYTSRTVPLRPTPPDSWIDLAYPTDFASAPSLTPGTYTIVWTTPLGPVACDGFTIG